MSHQTSLQHDPAAADHPKTFEPSMLVVLVVVSVLGAVIGMQILTTLGVTPNTAIIGVLVAIAISRIPIAGLRRFRSVHRQNLVQSNISTATFVAANSLLLPIAIPYMMGRADLVWPMLIGAAAATVIDFLMLYWMFDSRVFPGKEAWPPGLAAAEAIRAGDQGGRRAGLLGVGTLVGVVGSFLGVPMSAFGVAFIGNIVALTMFGVGLLVRGYSLPLAGIDINAAYIPHGVMIGAGVVALGQAIWTIVGRRRATAEAVQAGTHRDEITGQVEEGERLRPVVVSDDELTRDDSHVRRALTRGAIMYVVAAALLALIGGVMAQMSVPMVILWILFAAFACIAAEFVVGLSAMHSGWFPAFATALIFLTVAVLIGFPPMAVALVVGFIAAGGPAFADAGYDFKAGWLLRRDGGREWELQGRLQQFLAGVVGMAVALVVVALTWQAYFATDQIPPVARVFATTIKAGVDPSLIQTLLLWAIPGAVIQAVGGPKRQMGILLATGLLINNPLAGWAVMVGIVLRVAYGRLRKDRAAAETEMTIAAAGFIAGDALWSFGNSMYRLTR